MYLIWETKKERADLANCEIVPTLFRELLRGYCERCMEKEKPYITVEELTSDEKLREINKWLDSKLEEVFRGSDPRTYAQFRAFMRRCSEGKASDKSWLFDYHKNNFKQFFKKGQHKKRELDFKKHLTVNK